MIIMAFIAVLALVVPADAKGGKAKKGPPEPPDDPRILIASTDTSKQTVTFIYKRTGSTHTYTVDAFTSVTVNGNPGSLTNISEGQEVSDYVERDAITLDKIVVGPASAAPEAPDDGAPKKGKKQQGGDSGGDQ